VATKPVIAKAKTVVRVLILLPLSLIRAAHFVNSFCALETGSASGEIFSAQIQTDTEFEKVCLNGSAWIN
jgi:hypothetical protein